MAHLLKLKACARTVNTLKMTDSNHYVLGTCS